METNFNDDKNLYEFFKKLDRSLFVDNEYKKFANNDEPLPIGYEQTISQPTLVYEMTHILDLNKRVKVLEIGTGSGYQTAFLAEFAGEVYTVEKIKELSWKAVGRIMDMGYKNVNFKIGDGSEGWPDYAPYDRIIVTAAPPEVPQPLVDQLKPEGKMIIPVGKRGMQELLLIHKDRDGKISRESLGDVRFVKLKGEHGWKS